MERLTEKRDGQNVIPLRQDRRTKWSLCSAGMGDAPTQFLYGDHADKLSEYENLEEQGKLLKLPCKVGDTVYQHMIVGVDKDKRKPIYKIFKATVFKFSLSSCGLCFWTETVDEGKHQNEVPLSAFGKTVFLTKSEAEQKLKEMEAVE